MKALTKKTRNSKTGERIVHLWHIYDTFCGMKQKHGLKMANYWFGEMSEASVAKNPNICPTCAKLRAEELAQFDQTLDDWETNRLEADKEITTMHKDVLTWDEPVEFHFEHSGLVNSGRYVMEGSARGANIHWVVRHGEDCDSVQEVWPDLVQGSEFYRKLFSSLK